MILFKIYSYLLVICAIILGTKSTLVRAQTTQDTNQIEAKKFLTLINKVETSYFFELGKFTDNLDDLTNLNIKIAPPANSYSYKINVTEDNKLVQTVATPTKTRGLRTYTGALSFNNNTLNSILCSSNSPSPITPGKIQLVDNQLTCPTGFKIILHNAQQEAVNSIYGINRAQQAQFFEISSFANNKNDLQSISVFPSETYYDYTINTLEDGKVAQVLATPKFNGLKSYIGGTVFINNTFNSILCSSGSPTQVTPGKIQLVNNRLNCPAGFKIIFHNVEQEALNSVHSVNRAQQAQFFETSSFAKNKNDLESISFFISETYYNYTINTLENGKVAQVLAIPKFNGLKSYIGGIFFTNSTGTFNSIACSSEKPSKHIPSSIQLIEEKLQCPAGFQVSE